MRLRLQRLMHGPSTLYAALGFQVEQPFAVHQLAPPPQASRWHRWLVKGASDGTPTPPARPSSDVARARRQVARARRALGEGAPPPPRARAIRSRQLVQNQRRPSARATQPHRRTTSFYDKLCAPALHIVCFVCIPIWATPRSAQAGPPPPPLWQVYAAVGNPATRQVCSPRRGARMLPCASCDRHGRSGVKASPRRQT